MLARAPASNVTMADLAEWWQVLVATYGMDVGLIWSMTGSDELATWRFDLVANPPGANPYSEPLFQNSLVWPTASHKTVLGAVLWLLVGLEDQMQAHQALAEHASQPT